MHVTIDMHVTTDQVGRWTTSRTGWTLYVTKWDRVWVSLKYLSPMQLSLQNVHQVICLIQLVLDLTWRPGALLFNASCNEQVFSPKPWIPTLVPDLTWRPGALLFNASSNEQVFSPKPWKKVCADLPCRFWEKCKKYTL